EASGWSERIRGPERVRGRRKRVGRRGEGVGSRRGPEHTTAFERVRRRAGGYGGRLRLVGRREGIPARNRARKLPDGGGRGIGRRTWSRLSEGCVHAGRRFLAGRGRGESILAESAARHVEHGIRMRVGRGGGARVRRGG